LTPPSPIQPNKHNRAHALTPINDRYGNKGITPAAFGRNTELSHITAPPKEADISQLDRSLLDKADSIL